MERLDNIANIFAGNAWKAAQFKDDGKFPVIRIQNIGDNKRDEYVYWSGDYDEAFVVKKGDLLLSLSGSIKLDFWDGPNGLLNQRIVKIIPKENIDTKWLYYQLKNYVKKIELLGNHALVNNVSLTDLRELQLNVPSHEVQIQIANILSEAESLISQRKESLSLLDELLKSTFLEMFPNKAGTKTPLSNLVDIQSGQVDPRVPPYNKMVHVGGANIEPGSGKLLNLKLAHEESLISGKYLFDNNTVLYSKIRPYLNKVAIPNFKGLCSADIYPLTPKKSIHKHFLRYTLMSEDFLSYAEKHSDRTNIPKVNRDSLLKYEVSLPSIELQNKFAKTVEKVEVLKDNYQASLKELENLYGALSKRAFGDRSTNPSN